MSGFAERLGRDILIFDGGTGTILQSRGLKPGVRPETWNITNQAEIIRLHAEYIAAGADIIKTNTFGANAFRFTDGGEYSVEQIISAGLDSAHKAADDAGREVYVALDIGPTGRLVGRDAGFEETVECFARSVRAGASRADLVLLETFGDIAETRAALLAVKENCSLPLIVTNAYGMQGRTFAGSTPAVMGSVLSGMNADCIGMNCSVGPDEMLKLLPELLEYTELPVCVNPNAGMPRSLPDGSTVYDVTPEHFAACAVRMAKLGACVLGGCCGTTPAHIKALKRALGGMQPVQRRREKTCTVTSAESVYTFGRKLCVIGERINPTGKKKFKEALKAGDFGYAVNEAHSQAGLGADILDVNVGIPEIDEKAVLCETVQRLQQVCGLPLQIDSSSPAAMEAALRIYNGQALINSVNGSESSMSAVFPAARKYGGTVIALTLDENGIPDSPEGRYAIAERILGRAAEYGIGRERIIFDPLTLTLGSDPHAAEKTLESVKMIKAGLGCRCSLGVSNISFGLPDREAVNCEFLNAAIDAGLDAAIMNPGTRSMMLAAAGGSRTSGSMKRLEAAASKPACVAKADATLADCIYGGITEKAVALASELCAERDPADVIASYVIPALDRAGRDFESGVIFLPGLLASADSAIAALSEITSHMPAGEGLSKGGVVLATVEGDVHDIGKNIVGVMLRSYGFDVFDLGKNVPAEKIVRAAAEIGVKVVGLSALMTTTLPAMKRTIEALHKECPEVKTVVGGAVLTPEYAESIGADGYAADAAATIRFASKVYGD